MHTTNLRRVGGSVMLAISPIFLSQLRLKVGSTVGISVANGHLIIDSKPKPRYTLSKLLEDSDYSEPQSSIERNSANTIAMGVD